MSYQDEIAVWRQQRQQRENAYRLQEIRQEHEQHRLERDAAIQRGDAEEAEMRDTDCEYLEQQAYEITGPQQPQLDPRLVSFAQRNQQFFEKYGQRAFQALDEAHKYLMRPRNPNTNHPGYTGMGLRPEQAFTPAYFDNLKSLLELHGEQFLGVKYDRNEQS